MYNNDYRKMRRKRIYIKLLIFWISLIVLIGGGYDKGSSFDEWTKLFPGRVKHLVLIGVTAPKVRASAEKFGFTAVWFPVSEIPTNPEYLKYCEVNRCGNYRANYACPPDCGTPDEMRARLQSASAALVIQSQWSVPGYGTPEVLSSKAEHGAAVRRFRDALRKEGYDVFAVGYGPCSVCKPCKRKSGDPCPLPDQRVSCMSAYCVDVAALAARCALPFEWNPQRLYLFGMIMFCGE